MKSAVYLLALPLLAQQGVNLYSLEKERALGGQYASEIRKQSEAVREPSVQAYVDRVGRDLLSGLRLIMQPFIQFEVISGGDWTEPSRALRIARIQEMLASLPRISSRGFGRF